MTAFVSGSSHDLIEVSVEDAAVKASLRGLTDHGINVAVKRGVTLSARATRSMIRDKTRVTYQRAPNLEQHPNLSLFAAKAVKPVKVKKRANSFYASLGYSSDGFYGRFLSRGTGGRVQSSTGRFTGSLNGTDLIPLITRITDERTPDFITREIGIELRKSGLA